jgi:hypothetical protein
MIVTRLVPRWSKNYTGKPSESRPDLCVRAVPAFVLSDIAGYLPLGVVLRCWADGVSLWSAEHAEGGEGTGGEPERGGAAGM